jgi:hypothetical protein
MPTTRLCTKRAVLHFAPDPAVPPPSPAGTVHNFHAAPVVAGAGGVPTTLEIDGARLHRPANPLVIDVSQIASDYYRQLR